MLDLKACLRGEKAAWDAFVDRFARVIYAAVHRTLGSAAPDTGGTDVQDLAQEVFLRLIRNDYRLLKTYDPSRAGLSTWLTIVARSVAIDHVRRRRAKTVPLDAAAQLTDPSDSAQEGSGDLDVPPGLLSPRQQLVLRLLFDREMSVAEVADFLGVKAQTVRSTKHKAILKLREFFASR